MIKLKLNRHELYTLCSFMNPETFEISVFYCINKNKIAELDTIFNLIQIAEMASKKYLFTIKQSYNFSLKYSEAVSLLSYTSKLEESFDKKSYEYNVILVLKQAIHHQITNYQRRFYGQINRQNLLTGADQRTGGALKNLTR